MVKTTLTAKLAKARYPGASSKTAVPARRTCLRTLSPQPRVHTLPLYLSRAQSPPTSPFLRREQTVSASPPLRALPRHTAPDAALADIMRRTSKTKLDSVPVPQPTSRIFGRLRRALDMTSNFGMHNPTRKCSTSPTITYNTPVLYRDRQFGAKRSPGNETHPSLSPAERPTACDDQAKKHLEGPRILPPAVHSHLTCTSEASNPASSSLPLPAAGATAPLHLSPRIQPDIRNPGARDTSSVT
ncbi:hypothetical protein BV25DRAFT_1914825 [Artomyces pyxidatus]|uniref:Uncharacterized protein n=1 Tax=Artomyces pyxidatus TaxID=48021 RepID=A0ACB8T6H2_9AGAM|nr:hypothetical protein BV25DRAFT_1914825 [Artomyces pyxidatus]